MNVDNQTTTPETFAQTEEMVEMLRQEALAGIKEADQLIEAEVAAAQSIVDAKRNELRAVQKVKCDADTLVAHHRDNLAKLSHSTMTGSEDAGRALRTTKTALTAESDRSEAASLAMPIAEQQLSDALANLAKAGAEAKAKRKLLKLKLAKLEDTLWDAAQANFVRVTEKMIAHHHAAEHPITYRTLMPNMHPLVAEMCGGDNKQFCLNMPRAPKLVIDEELAKEIKEAERSETFQVLIDDLRQRSNAEAVRQEKEREKIRIAGRLGITPNMLDLQH